MLYWNYFFAKYLLIVKRFGSLREKRYITNCTLLLLLLLLLLLRQQLMIFATFVRVNNYNLYAQQQLLSHVSVANQKAHTTLSTVLVYTKFIQDHPLPSLAGHNPNHVLPSVYIKKAPLTIIKNLLKEEKPNRQ